MHTEVVGTTASSIVTSESEREGSTTEVVVINTTGVSRANKWKHSTQSIENPGP